ncbi:MAG: S49 family peptidase, partial [Deltaproteobacteria bacterium]|nr:S49 family peptidase [Deltaproteobacteria bacterium]
MRRFRSIALVGILLLVAWWWFSPPSGPTVAPGSTLVVEISGSYLEAAAPSLLSRLLGERRRPFVSILSELRKAERDDRLKTVVFRIRDLEVGWGKAQEIRDAIADLRSSGRKTLAYLEVQSFQTQKEYYVATAAESIYEAPASRAALVGLAAEYLFLGGMFEKIGVDVEVERIGRYKTAADTFAGREMSPAHREMVDSLLDSISGQFVAGIAEGRGLSPDAVWAAIESAPMTAEEMLELGLIDGISQYDELIASLGSAPVIEASEYAGVDPASLGFDPVAQFALVYGTGMVLVGKGTTSRSGNPVLASDTVS